MREDQDPTYDSTSGGSQPPTAGPPASAAPPTRIGPPIATNPGGQQIGSGIPWDTGPDSQPTGAPPGYTWDKNLAMFVASPGTAGTGPTGVQPTGGQITNPDYANQFVWWAGSQPGVNPSVKNDPGYWVSRFTSGAFGNDQAYALSRMMQAEGAPEGAGGGTPGAPLGPGAAPPPGAPGGSFNPGSFSYSSGYAPPPGISSELYNMLLKRAQQGTQVNADDPNIRQQIDPATAQIERDRRHYLEGVAEKRGPLANIQGESRVTAEQAGQAKSQLTASLIGKEIQSRRDEIQNALTSLGSQLNADQQRALQDELAHLNAALSKYGIDTSAGLQQQQINSNNDQFANTFNLNSTNQANYWDAVRSGKL